MKVRPIAGEHASNIIDRVHQFACGCIHVAFDRCSRTRANAGIAAGAKRSQQLIAIHLGPVTFGSTAGHGGQ
jgi:hypothetical protein